MKGQKGFTLIEILIAITVFAVGILAVSLMQSRSTGSNARAQMITTAATVAADQVERIISMEYDDVVTISPSPFATPEGFTASWTIEDDTPIKGSKKVTVRVTNTGSLFPTATELIYYKAQGV